MGPWQGASVLTGNHRRCQSSLQLTRGRRSTPPATPWSRPLACCGPAGWSRFPQRPSTALVLSRSTNAHSRVCSEPKAGRCIIRSSRTSKTRGGGGGAARPRRRGRGARAAPPPARPRGEPIAAPSANRYQGLSPTTAAHVVKELGDRVDLVLDAGPCAAGIESTVIDVRVDPPRVLRLGAADLAALRRVVPGLGVRSDDPASADTRASPGMDA